MPFYNGSATTRGPAILKEWSRGPEIVISQIQIDVSGGKEMFPHASGGSGTQNTTPYSSHPLHSDHFDDSKELENIKKFENPAGAQG